MIKKILTLSVKKKEKKSRVNSKKLRGKTCLRAQKKKENFLL